MHGFHWVLVVGLSFGVGVSSLGCQAGVGKGDVAIQEGSSVQTDEQELMCRDEVVTACCASASDGGCYSSCTYRHRCCELAGCGPAY